MSCGDRRLTYGELEDASLRLAGVLVERGAGRGALVGLLVDRSPAMVVALVGILKAGAGYVPLDPAYPAARLGRMLELSGAALVVSERAVVSRLDLGLGGSKLVLLDEPAGAVDGSPGLAEDSAGERVERGLDVEPEACSELDTAYVIFTSGSTGEPKGVEIQHGALVNLFRSLGERPGMRGGDTVLAVTSLSFDIAAAELLLPLTVGARVEIATQEQVADPVRLLARLEASGATIMQATPVTWRMLIGAGWSGTPRPGTDPRGGLRVWCGGEEMTRGLARELVGRGSEVWNLYGPTETCVWSAVGRVTAELVEAGAVPLGEPVRDTQLYVLDEGLRPVSVGEAEELYIGGAGLAKGYWGRADLTEAAFPAVDLGEGSARLYRTGDRVRLQAGGRLEFLGRLDRQVKLRGFRIELGEVEQAAAGYAGVAEVVVMRVEDAVRGDFLACYVAPAPGYTVDTLDAAGLRRHIARVLPRYMVPATVRVMERLPVTPNGKVDRKQLPAPGEDERTWVASTDESGAPLDELEARLAEMWREALRARSIGRDDNFFAMGGDSLLAAQLVAKMAKEFGRACNVASLLQSPTIALYATFLTGGTLPNYIVLAEGRPEKRNQAIFWMDNPDSLHHLAGLLEGHPFYSMLLSAEDIALEAPEYRLERLAGRMVEQILERQSEGQFYVGGFCQNALLAYEVGQQLRARGYEVPLLIMVDTDDVSMEKQERPVVEAAMRRMRRERFHLTTMFKRPTSEWIPYLQRRYDGIRFVLEEKKWQRIARTGEGASEPARELAQALFVSRLSYVPKPYGGRVLFLEAELRPERDEQAAMEEWNALVPGAIWRRVMGEHLGLFSFPVVNTVSAEVRAVLGETA